MKNISLFFLWLLSCNVLTSTAQSTEKANIILIIGDDMRYDSFLGNVPFFETPGINRIAEEGVNFKNSFCVYSLCIPARSTIMTGLYPHSHGAVDNFSKYHKDLTTIAIVLNDNGYNTAMFGKYDETIKHEAGWDYWMALMGATDYTDPKVQYFNQKKIIPGHVTQVLMDSSLHYLASVDTPFFITIAHLAPHKPVIPLPQNDEIYSLETMPVPSNFSKYTKNYPSFLYENEYYKDTQFESDTARLEKDYEVYFEGLKGIDDHMLRIFDSLEARGLLDKTMIVFMADNGSLYGEHALAGKGLPYEASMRIPLFIRYPQWFNPNTVIENEIALNLDIATTLADAAGVEGSDYGFQGISLNDLGNGTAHRDQFVFENIKLDHPGTDGDTAANPSFRTLRTLQYKYTFYSCDKKTEELFDLTLDPLENTNIAKKISYAAIIEDMRTRLDSMLIVINDTLSADTIIQKCRIVKGNPGSGLVSEKESRNNLRLEMNMVNDRLNFFLTNMENFPSQIVITNPMGQIMFSETISSDVNDDNRTLSVTNWPSGIYFIGLQQGDYFETEVFIKD